MIYLKISKNITSYEFLKKHTKSIFSEILNHFIKEKRFELNNFDNYFKDNYNLSLYQFFDKLENSINIQETKNKNIILINGNEKIKDTRLEELISIIDYGNTKIKGCGLIREVVNYLKENLETLVIYKMI